MGSIKFIPTQKRIRWPGRGKILNNKTYALIANINFILEMIIRNTIKFNKLTSADEIYENLMSVLSNGAANPAVVYEMDVITIIDICDALCGEKGVLIKLKKNDESLYRLNYHEEV
jgi:hypothetical protein